MHTDACSKTYTHTRTHTHVRTHTRMHTRTRTHARARARAHAHTHTHARTRTHTHARYSRQHPSPIRLSCHSSHTPSPPGLGAGPAHRGKQAGRTHCHACSQLCVGLPPKSLYPDVSPKMRALSSLGKGGVATSQGLGAGSLGLSQEALLGSLGMREDALIWVPSRFSGKANAPPPLFPQVIISSSLWNQPIQAEAIWLQTGAPRRA